GCFTIAICGEGIEADLCPVKQRATFKVVDRDAIFHGEPSKIGAQGQALIRRQTTKVNLRAAANVRLYYPCGAGIAGSVELAIANAEHLLHQVKRLLRRLWRQDFYRQLRFSQLLRQRNLAAPNERLSMKIKAA